LHAEDDGGLEELVRGGVVHLERRRRARREETRDEVHNALPVRGA
jgi:hypothetical protein